jgi:hypothetical protein
MAVKYRIIIRGRSPETRLAHRYFDGGISAARWGNWNSLASRVPQPSQAIISAAAIVGQNQRSPLAESIALKRRTVASAPRLRFPLAAHPGDVVADFVVASVVAHRRG